MGTMLGNIKSILSKRRMVKGIALLVGVSIGAYLLASGSNSILNVPTKTTPKSVEINPESKEIAVYVIPGEPTQVGFPVTITGGFKKKNSSLSLDRKGENLVIFSNDSLTEKGEAIIVRLMDDSSYHLRVFKASNENPRMELLRLENGTGTIGFGSQHVPSSTISGLMRGMILTTQFGKNVPFGYRESTKHNGEIILNDGKILAKLDRIFIGSNLWGYALDVENLQDNSQRIDPSVFRLDGTKAITATNWELAPRPLKSIEPGTSKHTAKVYVVTRGKISRGERV